MAACRSNGAATIGTDARLVATQGWVAKAVHQAPRRSITQSLSTKDWDSVTVTMTVAVAE